MAIKICADHDKVIGQNYNNPMIFKALIRQNKMQAVWRNMWVMTLLMAGAALLPVSVLAAKESQENETKIKITADDRLKALERITSMNQSPEILRQEIYKGTVLKNLPDVLATPAAKDTLIARLDPPIYKHNPIKGPVDAPITIIEFSDISCLTCPSYRKDIEKAMDKYPDVIRWVHKHASDNPYKSENIAVFYSKIANKNGLFWEFRRQLEKLKSYDDNTLTDALSTAGLPIHNSRRLVRLYAREVYREIDADMALNRQLGLSKSPAMLVNGVQVGGGIPEDALNELIEYELDRKKITLVSDADTGNKKKTKH